MSMLEIGPEEALYYEHAPPADPNKPTFVFVNPITGDTSLWTAQITPALNAAGYGTLVYDFRGQAQSRYAVDRKLDADLIVEDLKQIVGHAAPTRPVLVGLSIGGLYAARAALEGLDVAGVVFINTLRRMTPRVAWMNDATKRVLEVGGPNLLKDLYFHLLVGEGFQAANRSGFLADQPDYTPLARDSGPYNLVTHMVETSWDVDWGAIRPPILSITGLQDRVFYDAAIVDELFAGLRDARRLDVAEAGHMLPAETPEPLIAALKDFAAEIEAR